MVRPALSALQLERWLEIMRTRTEQGIIEGLSEEFTGRIIRMIHEESIRCQDEVMKKLRSAGGCTPSTEEGEEE